MVSARTPVTDAVGNTAHGRAGACGPDDECCGMGAGPPGPGSGPAPDDCLCVPRLEPGRAGFRLFTEGDDLYEDMLAAIRSAHTDIRLESFIFAADQVGWRFAGALAERARAGVDVRFHFDARGAAFRASASLVHALAGAGVQLRWYHPFSWRAPRRYLHRNHRKLLVTDGTQAFLGGFNVRLENSRALYGDARQRDTHVRVTGELAQLAARLFDRLWEHTEDPDLDAVPAEIGNLDAVLVPNFSRRCQRRLACLHAGLIGRARDRAYLTTPYFCPASVVERAMRAAARRGVDVRLLVPRASDPAFAGWATRAAYARLLQAGVRVFEYGPRKLHAKTSLVDDEWAVVGSANLDYLSLFVNQELILVARDPDLAAQLGAVFLDDVASSREVMAGSWAGRTWTERALEAAGRAARRAL